MNLHASAASQRIMEDGSIWVEIRRNPEDASASHWLRALLPLSEAGLLPSASSEPLPSSMSGETDPCPAAA